MIGSGLFQIDNDGGQNYYLVVVDQYSGLPLVARFNKAPRQSDHHQPFRALVLHFWLTSAALFRPRPAICISRVCTVRKATWIPMGPVKPLPTIVKRPTTAAVKYTKTLLKDHHKDWKKFNEALMLRRNVPNKSGASLAEMFRGHKQRTLLSMLPGQYNFQMENAIKSAEKRKKICGANYQNRKRKKLQPLKIGQCVVIETMQSTIDKILHEGTRYNIATTGGAQFQRNRVMLCPVYKTTSDELSDSKAEDSTHGVQESKSNHRGSIHENTHTTPAQTRSSSRVPVPQKPCTC